MEFIVGKGHPCAVVYGENEPEAVRLAAENLKADLKKVFGEHVLDEAAQTKIYIGTTIAPEAHKEQYRMQVRGGALYIEGSDRRGTVYGIYEFCQSIGVSPWYFWADVPVKKRDVYVLPEGFFKEDYPTVEYRGIFINDEEELEAWVKNRMGEETIGVKIYEKVFELLLRLKANYIWPAMHVNSFNMNKENGALAERMGIVVGTSHCDMLMRSNNREWRPWLAKKGYEGVSYDYSRPGRDREVLKEYWRESVEQNKDFEVCYTIGMRGIHDSGFETAAFKGMEGEELKAAKIGLLQTVINDQRELLRDTLGHDTMMTFVPYKEVLPLYDGGLEVPEDVTLVWANDNYGYIRRYPSEKERNRKGGNGIYYHNSYWAPPGMSYVFLCSIPLAHTANELRKAYAEGVRKLWVMNVGAMKPLEQEMEFFLTLAWEIGKEGAQAASGEDVQTVGKEEAQAAAGEDVQTVGRQGALTDDVDRYVEDWINRNFSGGIGAEAAKLLNDFSQVTNMRKVEMMDTDAFSQTAYGDEAAARVHAYEEMFARGNALYASLPGEERDAFFQMVLMRIHATYFTNLAYYYGDRSTLMYDRGNMQAAAEYVKKTRELEDARRRMVVYYNTKMAGGKWDGILNPEGFPPPRAAMMPVCTPPLSAGEGGMHVSLWNGAESLSFTRPAVKWIEIGNGGAGELDFVIREAPDWVRLSEQSGRVRTERRVSVSVEDVSADRKGHIVITDGAGGQWVSIPVSTVHIPGNPAYVENDGMAVIEAACADAPCGDFKRIGRLGRGFGSLMEACVSREPEELTGQAGREASGSCCPCLQYSVAFTSEGEFTMEIHRFPSLNSTGRIRIGVSADGGEIQIAETEANDEHRGTWRDNVRDNVDRMYVKLPYLRAGEHCIRIYAVDKYFAFSRFAVYTGERKENNFAAVYNMAGAASGRNLGMSADMTTEGNARAEASGAEIMSGLQKLQRLPAEFDAEEFSRDFYGEISLKPRPVEYAPLENPRDTLVTASQARQEEAYAETVEAGHYLRAGKSIFEEREGMIRIDAACVLAGSVNAYVEGGLWKGDGSVNAYVEGGLWQGDGSVNAYAEGGLWRHCASESYGRSGLAMYIRKRGTGWHCVPESGVIPSLNYRMRCQGGEYVLWLLLKYGMKEELDFGVGIDGRMLGKEELLGKGNFWRYEAEQIYRYVPVARLALAQGDHLLSVYARAAGLRFDRICLVKGDALPPADSEWKG